MVSQRQHLRFAVWIHDPIFSVSISPHLVNEALGPAPTPRSQQADDEDNKSNDERNRHAASNANNEHIGHPVVIVTQVTNLVPKVTNFDLNKMIYFRSSYFQNSDHYCSLMMQVTKHGKMLYSCLEDETITPLIMSTQLASFQHLWCRTWQGTQWWKWSD